MLGINIRTDNILGLSYADLIVDGLKRYETRDTNSLKPYIGRCVAIVRTGEGKALAIGTVEIGEPIVVGPAQFRELQALHLVPAGSMFDIKPDGIKYLYPLTNPKRFEPRPVAHGIIARKVITDVCMP